MASRWVAAWCAAAALIAVGCSGSGGEARSVAGGGLPVYSVGAPDVDPLDTAVALAAVLELPDAAAASSRGEFEARIDGGGHDAVVRDRRAGSIIVSYSGPRFGNPECLDCPPLDATDDAQAAIDRSREILDALGVDTSTVAFTEGLRSDVLLRVVGDVVIGGTIIDDLGFEFAWTHGGELMRFSGGLFEIETIGTVEPRREADARAQVEELIGSDRSIVDFELVYTGAFRDGELIVAPSYVSTTDLGTTFSVSGFDGELPG